MTCTVVERLKSEYWAALHAVHDPEEQLDLSTDFVGLNLRLENAERVLVNHFHSCRICRPVKLQK